MKTLIVVALCGLACAAGNAQTPPAETELQRLYAYSRSYRERLPSLTCDESIVSQRVKHGKVKKTVRIEATLRMVRDGKEPDPFDERHDFKTVDGKPAKAFFKIPFLVQGGFANAVGFAQPEMTPCFDYTLSVAPGGVNMRMEMTPNADAVSERCRAIPRGYRRIVVFEPASGRIIHSERTYPAEGDRRSNEVYFAAMDYAPQRLGDEVFWLPRKLQAHDEKDEGRMDVIYTNYHRYAGEMKVLPGEIAPQQ